MSASPELLAFVKEIPPEGNIGRDEFQRRIDSASDEFIDEFLRETNEGVYRRHYVSEVQKARRHKQLATPHWSVVPNFWLTVIAAVGALIAAIDVILRWASGK